MRTVTDPAALRALLREERRAGRTVGFVPTMGFLHEGHMSLVERARGENEVVVVSIFVNPTQFGPGEDYEAYPRDPDHDAALLDEAGADLLFIPSPEAMYPEGFATHVEVAGLSDIMCGAFRPGHFRGVATVVAKLFSSVGPARAYFGEKDYQQLIVIKRMVADLDMPVEVVGCPTVREADALALSSRNVYLSAPERAMAPALHKALVAAADLVAQGESDPARVRDAALAILDAEPSWAVEYVEVRDAETLAAVERIERRVVIAAAGRLGKARLIDNVVVAPG
jgi:pantoate--beta-alanine ligase